MKAVFSFWSKCFKESSDRRVAGFYNEHFFITSFKLAIACARKSFKHIEFYTDAVGYKLLVLDNGLEFDKVHIVLDDLNDLPADLWMLGKLYTYSLQREPFMHLDYDLYLLKPVPDTLHNMPIIVQCEESLKHTDVYEWGINWVHLNNQNQPIEFSYSLDKSIPYKYQAVYNVGMIGGQNFEDLAKFGGKALQLVRDNTERIKSLPTDKQNRLNIVYEQYYFTQYMQYHNIPVTQYMPDALQRYEFNNDVFVHMLNKVKNYHSVCVDMEEVYLSKFIV